MAEYIERESLKEKFRHILVMGNDGIMQRIDEEPSADVVEVRHGYWRQNPHCKRIYYCSECGRNIEDGSNNPLAYFPYCHCGAKMDGKGEV